MPNLSLSKVTPASFQLSTTRPHSYAPERVADDPWKLLVATMLLNKTAGRVAVPIFWKLIERWPTPDALAQGNSAPPFSFMH